MEGIAVNGLVIKTKNPIPNSKRRDLTTNFFYLTGKVGTWYLLSGLGQAGKKSAHKVSSRGEAIVGPVDGRSIDFH